MIPIRDKKTDIASEIAQGKNLQKKIISLAQEAANRTISSGETLNVIIADIAKREGLNRLQIQRLVEEGNTVTYNKRYDKLRASHDRRITFPIASLDGIIDEMGFSAPPPIVNPNLSVGGKGEGELDKAASVQIETSPIHTPHSKVKQSYDKYLQKTASFEQKKSEQQKVRDEREYNSNIFKIANSLVMTEKHYKNANEVYNTLLSQASLSDEEQDLIVKKASTIAEHLVKTKRTRPDFMVTLRKNSEEKIAEHVLGQFSLLKQAEDNLKVKEVKVQPTVDVADFSQLINIARELEQQQKKQSTMNQSEVNFNGSKQ